MDIYELLCKLTAHDGISGFEGGFAENAAEILRTFCDEVTVSRHGCAVGLMRSGTPGAKKLMLEAHLDRIGLIVTGIDDDGFVSFSALGGVDERILPASEVYIQGKRSVYGIIGAVPPHLTTASDRSAAPRIEDMLIDTGMRGEDLRQLVRVGDPILLKSECVRLSETRVSSAALDNRAGMAAVIDCAQRIRGKSFPYDIYITFTSGEESGLHGAYTVAADFKPDLAVVVDVTFGETHDSPENTSFPLGCGAVVFRGPNTDRRISKRIEALADEKAIPRKTEVSGGSSGTNAWALQTAFGGIRCALISIPLRYMHTTVETADIRDIENVGRLLAEISCGGVELD